MDNNWPQIKAWRRSERARLIAERMALAPVTRQPWSAAIEAHLRGGFPIPRGAVVGFCWPFKNEFDVRFVLRDFREGGAVAALPVVVDKAGPLQFRPWRPGVPMVKGVYDIPYPQDTATVLPDVALVPMNGFDEQGYRLGYGGGYFDRTLAALSPRPVAVGLAYECARMPSIQPQPHDIAMDFVVTEAGVHAVRDGRLEILMAAECGARFCQLLSARGLPWRTAAPAQGYSSPVCYAAEFPGYFSDDAPQAGKAG